MCNILRQEEVEELMQEKQMDKLKLVALQRKPKTSHTKKDHYSSPSRKL